MVTRLAVLLLCGLALAAAADTHGADSASVAPTSGAMATANG